MQTLKDKIWRTRDKREAWMSIMTSFTPARTRSNAQSSHLSHPLFHIRASSFKPVLSPLDFSLFFCPPPPPLTLQSQAFGCQWDQATARCMSVEKNGWLIQSSLLFLRQRRVISGTAKAFWCIAFMLSLAPSPLPQKSKLLWSGGGERRASQTHQRPERACFSGVTHSSEPFTFTARNCCHSSEESSVRCQRHVPTRRESYQSVFRLKDQLSGRHHTNVPPMNVIFVVYMILGINYV